MFLFIYSYFYVLIQYIKLSRSDLTRPYSTLCISLIYIWQSLTAYILNNIINIDVQFWLYKSWNCPNKIWFASFLQFRNYVRFGILEISSIFGSFFIIAFDWMGNFQFYRIYRKDLVQFNQNQSFFNFKLNFFIGFFINEN